MDLLTGAALIIEVVKVIIGLIDGGKSIIIKNKQVIEKLVRVYREILKNKNTLKQSGLLNTNRIDIDDKTFISVVKNLSNVEIEPLFAFNRKGIIAPNGKKAIQRRKTQYAINYIVTQIDALKTLLNVKRNHNAPAVRLTVRLRTLYKHMETLEKVLLPVK